MTILTIEITLIEFVIMPIVVILFGVTLFFFFKSRKSLQKIMQESKKKFPFEKDNKYAPQKRSSLVEMEEQFAKMRYQALDTKQEKPAAQLKNHLPKNENLVIELRNTISEQQKLLDSYLQKVEAVESERKQELNHQVHTLEKEITKLHLVIEKKDEEMEDLQQQASAAQKMAARIEEVYKEFDLLQEKMMQLEKQANRANNLAIELEDTKHAYELVHKELLRKHEKMEEVMNENQNMRQQMNELEDKLSDANLQRQQLQKKVLFLTDLNNDMQNISETNKKLQTELRRIGELESMLSIMAEERELLLRSRQQNNKSSL